MHARYENVVVAGADDKYPRNMDSYSRDLPIATGRNLQERISNQRPSDVSLWSE